MSISLITTIKIDINIPMGDMRNKESFSFEISIPCNKKITIAEREKNLIYLSKIQFLEIIFQVFFNQRGGHDYHKGFSRKPVSY